MKGIKYLIWSAFAVLFEGPLHRSHEGPEADLPSEHGEVLAAESKLVVGGHRRRHRRAWRSLVGSTELRPRGLIKRALIAAIQMFCVERGVPIRVAS